MFYRPNFCCQCGEKIERPRWTPLTSRRFCEFCEIEQKQHELLPRAAAILVLLVGAAGLIAYFNGAAGQSAGPQSGAGRSGSNREFGTYTRQKPESDSKRASGQANLSHAGVSNGMQSANASPSADLKQREAVQNSSIDPVYYCGAITKKGTPCTRRVKTKTRCWQHLVQPADR